MLKYFLNLSICCCINIALTFAILGLTNKSIFGGFGVVVVAVLGVVVVVDVDDDVGVVFVSVIVLDVLELCTVVVDVVQEQEVVPADVDVLDLLDEVLDLDSEPAPDPEPDPDFRCSAVSRVSLTTCLLYTSDAADE